MDLMMGGVNFESIEFIDEKFMIGEEGPVHKKEGDVFDELV